MKDEQRKERRKAQKRESEKRRWDQMSESEKEKKRKSARDRYTNMSPEERSRKLDLERQSWAKRKRLADLAEMSPEDRKRECDRWAKLTPEQREMESKRAYERHLMSEYGLTPEQRDAMFRDQGSCCAICKASEPGTESDWHTDHCHEHGHVRGILCHHCNLMLGLAKDNPQTLEAAIIYLKMHSA